MPISDKRLAANRANAQKSTGPKNPLNRLRTTRNQALANAVLIDGESRESFLDLLNSLHAEFQPETPSEHTLVEKVSVSQWRLLRSWTVESAGIVHEMHRQSATTAGQNAPTRAMLAMRSLGDNSRHSEISSRSENRYDRQHHRAMQALLRIKEQKNARQKQVQPDETKGTDHES